MKDTRTFKQILFDICYDVEHHADAMVRDDIKEGLFELFNRYGDYLEAIDEVFLPDEDEEEWDFQADIRRQFQEAAVCITK